MRTCGCTPEPATLKQLLSIVTAVSVTAAGVSSPRLTGGFRSLSSPALQATPAQHLAGQPVCYCG